MSTPMTTPERLRLAIAETLHVDAQVLQATIGRLAVATSTDYPNADVDARSVSKREAGLTVLLADRIPAGQEESALAAEIARHHGRTAAQALLGDRANELLGDEGNVDRTGVFQSSHEQHAARNGQSFVLLGTVDPSTYDADDVGPMYRIRFSDGEVIEAWPDEVQSALPQSKVAFGLDDDHDVEPCPHLYAEQWNEVAQEERAKKQVGNVANYIEQVTEPQGKESAPKNVLGQDAATPFYIWANDDCANKTDSFEEAKAIRLELFNEGGESVHIVDANGVEIVDAEIEAHEALAKHNYFAGPRKPDVKPEFPGAFMVNDPLDLDGYAIVGDDIAALILEARAHLLQPDDVKALDDRALEVMRSGDTDAMEFFRQQLGVSPAHLHAEVVAGRQDSLRVTLLAHQQSEQEKVSNAIEQGERAAAREYLIDALVDDQVSSIMGDSGAVKRLRALFRGGFIGFGIMSDNDLVACARESGIDKRFQSEVESLSTTSCQGKVEPAKGTQATFRGTRPPERNGVYPLADARFSRFLDGQWRVPDVDAQKAATQTRLDAFPSPKFRTKDHHRWIDAEVSAQGSAKHAIDQSSGLKSLDTDRMHKGSLPASQKMATDQLTGLAFDWAVATATGRAVSGSFVYRDFNGEGLHEYSIKAPAATFSPWKNQSTLGRVEAQAGMPASELLRQKFGQTVDVPTWVVELHNEQLEIDGRVSALRHQRSVDEEAKLQASDDYSPSPGM